MEPQPNQTHAPTNTNTDPRQTPTNPKTDSNNHEAPPPRHTFPYTPPEHVRVDANGRPDPDDLRRKMTNALDVLVRPPSISPLPQLPSPAEHELSVSWMADLLVDLVVTAVKHGHSLGRQRDVLTRCSANVGALIAQVHDLLQRTQTLERRVDQMTIEMDELTR